MLCTGLNYLTHVAEGSFAGQDLGTPSGVGYARTPPRLLHPGDTVEVEFDRLGTLTDPVVANDHRHATAEGDRR